MKLVLLSLVGIALALQHPQLRSVQPLQPRSEHRYRYEGSVLSGLPLPGQSAVTLEKVNVRVQYLDDKTALLQLDNFMIASGETEQKEARFDSLERREISSELKEILELPVRFHYKSGIVSRLVFHEQDKTWSENIKRAIVNLLQVNTQIQEQTEESLETPYTETETTIEGKCQVSYTIVPLAEEKIQLVKSVNFDKCERRPIAVYNARYFTECRECKEKKDIESQSVYTYTIQKESGIESVEVRSVYTYTMKDSTVLKTQTNARLVRESVEEIRSPISHPKGEEQDLIFSTEWEEKLENFFKNGDEMEQLPFHEYKNKIHMIKQSLQELKKLDETKPEHTHELARLVRFLRMCSKPELKTVIDDIYTSVEEQQQIVLLNALSIAGTKNTIEQVLSMIEKKTVSKSRSVQLLKSIQETPYPSAKIADLLIRFSQSQICEKSEPIRQSALLATGAIVRGVVSIPSSEKKQMHLINENTSENKEKFVRFFIKQIEESKDIYEKIVAIKALANAGIDISVHKLEKIIYNKNEETIVRVEAVDALRLLKDIMPRKIQHVLLPIYNNRFEKPELRIAALVQIIDSLPAKHVIAQIATNVDREPSRHVAEFTYHMLQQLSESSNPCHKRIAAETQTVLRMIRYKPTEGVLSVMKKLPLFSEEGMTGIDFNLATVFGSDSYLPKELSASFETLLGGNWNKYLAQIGIRQQNVDKMLRRLVEKIGRKQESEVSRASRNNMAVQLLSKVSQELSISSRRNSDKYSQAVIYLRYKDMDFAVLPVDEKIVERFIEKFISSGKIDLSVIERVFNIKKDFEVAQALYTFEITHKIPTILGLPLTITNKMPTVASISGRVAIEQVKSGAYRVVVKAEPSVVSTYLMSMGIWTPLFEQGTKTVHTINAKTPVDLKSEVAMKSEQTEIHFAVQMPEEKKRLVQFYSRPSAYFRKPHHEKIVLENTEITLRSPVVEDSARQIQREFVFAGLKTVVRGHLANEMTVENMLFSEQNLEIQVVPLPEAAKELTARLVVENLKKITMEMEPNQDMFDEELTVESNEYESREENQRREHYRKSSSALRGSEGFKQRTTIRLAAPGSIERFAEIALLSQCNSELRHCKVDVDVRRSPLEKENSEWTMKTTVDVVLPESVSSLKQLKEQLHREIQANVFARWGSSKKSEMTTKIQMSQDKQQVQWFKHADKDLQGMPAYELLSKAARLNQIKAVTEYKLTPESKHYFNKIYDILKGYTFLTNEIQIAENQRERMVFEMTVEPFNSRFVNVSVQTPEERLVIEEMILPFRMPLPSLVRRSIRNVLPLIKESVSAECTVKSSQISTFDEVVLRAPLTTCYSVIAKDCSEESRFDVRIKKVNKDTQEKKMKIVTKEQVYELYLVGEKLQVFVDGEKLREQKYEQYNVFRMSEKLVRVELEDVIVRFDGYTAKVQMSQQMQEKQCGLCGHYDGDNQNELRNAQNEEAEDLESFHRSYLLREECEIEQEESRLSNKKNYKIVQSSEESEEQWHPKRYEQVSEEKDEERMDRQDREQEPIMKIRVEEQSHRVCFSKRPVKSCKKSQEEVREKTEKVEFVCMPRHESETLEVLRQIRDNEEVSFAGRKHAYVRAIQVPQACIAY